MWRMICASCDRTVKAWPCDCGFTPKGYRESLKPAHQQRHYSNGVSKEQFGVGLYNTVFCYGEIHGLQAHIQQAIDKGEGYKLQDLKARREQKQREFAAQFVQLTNVEQADLLVRYPDAVNL